ncbi:DUF7522 family protein [Halovenus marina]|uniref:DUF7522 family protein n=1 Tax=Halovenus marina TaxID=3396621 RepID=UPI003F557436
MPGQEYQRLVRLIHDRAGDNFRSAWKYDITDWEVLYIRDDIATPELKKAVVEIFQHARDYEPIVDANKYEKMGEIEASVELYTDAVLIHFSETGEGGVVVTLEREASKDLAAFVDNCNSILNRS